MTSSQPQAEARTATDTYLQLPPVCTSSWHGRPPQLPQAPHATGTPAFSHRITARRSRQPNHQPPARRSSSSTRPDGPLLKPAQPPPLFSIYARITHPDQPRPQGRTSTVAWRLSTAVHSLEARLRVPSPTTKPLISPPTRCGLARATPRHLCLALPATGTFPYATSCLRTLALILVNHPCPAPRHGTCFG